METTSVLSLFKGALALLNAKFEDGTLTSEDVRTQRELCESVARETYKEYYDCLEGRVTLSQKMLKKVDELYMKNVAARCAIFTIHVLEHKMHGPEYFLNKEDSQEPPETTIKPFHRNL